MSQERNATSRYTTQGPVPPSWLAGWHDLCLSVQPCCAAADHFITHNIDGIDKTNEAIEALHGGECLRAVVKYCDY